MTLNEALELLSEGPMARGFVDSANVLSVAMDDFGRGVDAEIEKMLRERSLSSRDLKIAIEVMEMVIERIEQD